MRQLTQKSTKIKLQKKLEAYSQADFTVKEVKQDLGRLGQQQLHAVDKEIAVFKRPQKRELTSDEKRKVASQSVPRFPNFPYAYSQRVQALPSLAVRRMRSEPGAEPSAPSCVTPQQKVARI
jgi:hypothetical protein